MRRPEGVQRTQQQPKANGDPFAHLPPKVGACCTIDG
jgi:hypothetical protein